MKKIVPFIKKRWKLLSIITLVIAGIAFWAVQSQASKKVELITEKPTRGTLIKTIEVNGVIDAKEKAQLRFAVGGKVVYLGAKEGEFVKKGQTIASIDKAILQKQLQQNLNDYSKERIDFEESRDADQDRTLERTELRTKEKEQYDLENSVLAVEIQNLSFRDAYISAPFAGMLTKAPTAVTGVNLLASDIFEVINPQTLIFRAAVDETDIANIKIGQSAVINLDAYPDDEVETAIQYISYTSSQASSGTVYLVELPVSETPNLDYFRLGMNGDVAIKLEEKNNVLSIPLDATIEKDDKIFVEIKKADGTTEEKEIQTGMETEDRIEVISGLTENDDVVIPS